MISLFLLGTISKNLTRLAKEQEEDKNDKGLD